ncbi:hypothetical protein ACNKHQ_15095 [Shigella flexneri]
MNDHQHDGEHSGKTDVPVFSQPGFSAHFLQRLYSSASPAAALPPAFPPLGANSKLSTHQQQARDQCGNHQNQATCSPCQLLRDYLLSLPTCRMARKAFAAGRRYGPGLHPLLAFFLLVQQLLLG